jgi:hypothetical protein
MKRLERATRKRITAIFRRLDYHTLGRLYCDEGGEAFWTDRRGPCQEFGIRIAEALLERLPPGGRSLYVGAGVAEIPVVAAEVHDLGRHVTAHNLRVDEARVLNEACRDDGFIWSSDNARVADGPFDHLWIASVLNDPELFPELSALSYGRANPAMFDCGRFEKERNEVMSLTAACMGKLANPAWVTTSIEEIPWIAAWCQQNGMKFVIEGEDYPTAIVGDPLCFIRIGEDR